MERRYNLKSPAVKRLMKEAQELKDATEHYYAAPMEDNLFEWHFTIRGPADSEFDGGIYHGRIILPAEYPMKPPSIMLLTPNGRFETYTKICLSISGHHPESWQPSWSIRTALLAIIGFMPTHGNGALGSLDYTAEERKKLAKSSQDFCCPQCGLIKNILKEVSPESDKTSQEAKDLASQINFQAEKAKQPASSAPSEPAPEGMTGVQGQWTTTAVSAPANPFTSQFPSQWPGGPGFICPPFFGALPPVVSQADGSANPSHSQLPPPWMFPNTPPWMVPGSPWGSQPPPLPPWLTPTVPAATIHSADSARERDSQVASDDGTVPNTNDCPSTAVQTPAATSQQATEATVPQASVSEVVHDGAALRHRVRAPSTPHHEAPVHAVRRGRSSDKVLDGLMLCLACTILLLVVWRVADNFL